MKAYLTILILWLFTMLSCSKNETDNPKSTSNIAFKVDNTNVKISGLQIEEVNLDYDQGKGIRAFSNNTEIADQKFVAILEFKPVNDTYVMHKVNLTIDTKTSGASYYRKTYYANLHPELNDTNFLANTSLNGDMLQGTFSGQLNSADNVSPPLNLQQGSFSLKIR